MHADEADGRARAISITSPLEADVALAPSPSNPPLEAALTPSPLNPSYCQCGLLIPILKALVLFQDLLKH